MRAIGASVNKPSVGDSTCHGLANLRILEGIKIVVQAGDIEAVVNRRTHYLHIFRGRQLLRILVRNLERKLRITAFDQGTPRRCRRHFADNHPLHSRQWPSRPLVIALINQLLTGFPPLDLEGAAACRCPV